MSLHSPQRHTRHGHAIVVGGSVTGLLAARVLLDHFDQVTLIERDRFPTSPQARPGVPQSQHVHVLLTQGQRHLERLFPGLLAELTAAQAPVINWTADWETLGMWGWYPRCDSDLVGCACSRMLLEWTIRRRLSADSRLTLREECRVTNLLSSRDRRQVIGVQVSQRPSSSSQSDEATLIADLVVDASGRNSDLPQWLTALGYPAPQETAINSFLGYASRWYQPPADRQFRWKGITLTTSSIEKNSRGGVLFPIEDNRWIVTLAGMGRDYPPTDDAGFLDFARSLRDPMLYEAIRAATPLSPIYSYRRTENRWRHYEQMTQLPEGVVAIGDAVCAFNPIYGQGMTVATLGALTLDQCLKQYLAPRSLKGLAHRVQTQLAQLLKTPWLLATGEDCRWPTTEGVQQDSVTRLMQGYFDRVTCLATENPALFRTFAEVLHMVRPPTALFRPNIIAHVLADSVIRPLQRQSTRVPDCQSLTSR